MRWRALLLVLAMTDEILHGTHPLEEHARPLSGAPSRMVDATGALVYTDEVDPAEAIPADELQGAGAGAGLSTLLTHGLYNADWRYGPPDPSEPISDMNPLPSWRLYVVQGGGVEVHWVDSATSKSGKALRFTTLNPAADDEVYLEQIVEVGPHDDWVHFRATAEAVDDVSGSGFLADMSVAVQFYDKDGATTGSEVNVADADGGATQIGFSTLSSNTGGFAVIPADARWVAFRLRALASAGTGLGHRDINDVYHRKPDIIYATYACSDVDMPGTGTVAVRLVSASSDGTPVDATNRYVPPLNGYVVAVSVKLSTDRTAGTLTFRAYNEGRAAAVGPTATINGTDTIAAVVYQSVGTDQEWHFEGEIDTLRVEATGTSFTPTTADALVHVTLALFPAVD